MIKCQREKKPDLSLREKEKLLERDLANGISLSGGDMTVLELVEKYLEQKRNVRPTTAAGYKTVVNVLKRDSFGSQKINPYQHDRCKGLVNKITVGGWKEL